ncbi:amino acid adenylation domain-containing protein [Actinomycetes bacterium KLBMP 9759]
MRDSGTGRELPGDATGELWVSGTVLARGYLRRPELDAEKFVATAAGRAYRTGDLVRRTGGVFEYLGRIDDQVKIRGFRIELGEVAAALAAHPEVTHPVVLPVADEGGTRRLVAYAEARDGSTVSESALRSWLRQRLPAHMVPSRIGVLERLPIGPSGKVDRAALLAMPLPRPGGVPFTAPRTDTEHRITEVLSHVLGTQVGVHDRFINLGGHSLAAAAVAVELELRYGWQVPAALPLTHPTAALMSAQVEATNAGAARVVPRPTRHPGRTVYPLTGTQQDLWTLRQLHPDVPATTVGVRLGLHGPVDETTLRAALDGVVRRHDVLRSTVTGSAGGGHAVVHEPRPVPLEVVDLRGRAEPAVAAAAITRRAAAHVFDLAADVPLIRAVLLRLADELAELVVVVDHLAFDGASIGQLIAQLAAGMGGDPDMVGGGDLQVGDIALHERALAGLPGRQDRLRAFWSSTMAGSELPDDLRGSAATRSDGTGVFRTLRATVEVPPALVSGLRDVATTHGFTVPTVYLTALSSLVSAMTGRADSVVGVTAARRSAPGLGTVIGPLVDILPVRVATAGAATFRVLANRTAKALADALSHQELPATELARCGSRTPGMSANPVVLSVQPDGVVRAAAGRLRIELLGEIGSGWSANPLTFFVNETVSGTELQIEYAVDRFDHDDATAMARRLIGLLTSAVADPDEPTPVLQLVTPIERDELLALGTGVELPAGRPTSVVDAVTAQASLRPDAIAVDSPVGTLTYAELVATAGRIALALQEHGVGPGATVAVGVPRDHLLPAALLAVLATGAAYVPLDLEQPPDRLRRLVVDSDAQLVLHRGPHEIAGVRALDLDGITSERGPVPLTAPDPASTAYLIFTSGSTGRPKCVQVSHGALAAFVTSMAIEPGFGPDDRMMAVAPLTYDVSAEEIWLPLSHGGTCVVVEQDCAIDGYALAARMGSTAITTCDITPTSLQMLLAAGWQGDQRLRVLAGGEVLEPQLAAQLLPLVGELWNSYGPAETTVTSAQHRVRAADLHEDMIPIGHPVPGERLFVMDPAGRLAPRGATGELWIGGAGVTLGYRNLPDRTEQAFVADPFHPGQSCYRTGDVVRWRADGTLEFLGRRDGQIKVRGHRIELGEVEDAVRRHPAVDGVAATVFGVGPSAALCCVVTPSTVPLDELNRHLRATLPRHMVPSRTIARDSVPVLPSGKADRAAVAALTAIGAGGAGTADRPPVRGDAQLLVADVWQAVLDIAQVWADDDFFEMGGSSFAATQVAGVLREAIGIAVPVRLLFDHPVLGDFAVALSDLLTTELVPAATEDTA